MTFAGKTVSVRTIRCGAKGVFKRHGEAVVLVVLLGLLLWHGATRYLTAAALFRLVDWETIAALAGIILITTAIRRSRWFDRLALRVVAVARDERTLALALALTTAALATFLTNDIALLIMVPLTLSMQALVDNDITRMVIFEALAANVGSMLTPVGNPQNLFLWHRWGLSFPAFVAQMAWPVALLTVLLLAMLWLLFPPRPLALRLRSACAYQARLAAVSLLALAAYIVLAEMRLALYAFPALLLLFAVADRSTLREANWPLVAVFVLMFVDFNLLATVGWVQALLGRWGAGGGKSVFLEAVAASQVVSNVPAAILLARFSHAWRALALGVNVGGNGLFIGSLANLIALKMVDDPAIWRTFHKYSLVYLALSAGLVYWLML